MAQTVWVLVHLDQEDRLEIDGISDTFNEAFALVCSRSKAGCVEMEVGKDYSDVKKFKIHTMEHPEGMVC